MQLSTLVYCSVFLLCCGGLADATAVRLRLSVGAIAASALLLAALTSISIPLGLHVTLNAGMALLLVASAILCRGLPDMVDAMLLALGAGAVGFLLLRVLPRMAEPGIFVAVPAAMFARLVFRRKRTAQFAVAAAPLFYAVACALESYFLFDSFFLEIGGSAAVGAQALGLVLLALLWYVPQWERKKRRTGKIRT